MTVETLKIEEEDVSSLTKNPAKCGALMNAALVAQDIPRLSTPYRRRYSLERLLRGVRSEMAATYQGDEDRGCSSSSEGTRYVYVSPVQIAKVLEVAELERRLALLEAKSVKS